MSRHKPHRRLSESHRPYLLEWSAQERLQRDIINTEDLECEMAAEDRHGWNRLAVLRGQSDGANGWWWEFPEEMRRLGDKKDGEKDDEVGGVRICRASLVVRNRLYILILDGMHSRRSTFETSLWSSLLENQTHQDLIAQTVHSSWLATLSSLPPLASSPVDMQHVIARALETNTDATRAMERRGETCCVTPGDWACLSERMDRRMQISVALAMNLQLQEANGGTKEKNGRSLDRITYLGGLLLPLTVVSGILSIEGTYGPEGSAFWVFWLAAGLSSVVAILAIHADHMRTLDVWMEVAAAEILGGGDEERGEARYVARGRTWRRKELGWAGALKKMSGWYWWRGSPGMEFRMPSVEVKIRGFGR